MSIRKPKIDAPTPLEQLKQIKSYLFQLVDELENELSNPSGSGSSVDNSNVMSEVQNALQISRQAKKIAENIDLSKYFLIGEGAPTTDTIAPFVGGLYLDTINDATYQCTSIDSTIPSYTWVKKIRETDYARGYANSQIADNFKAGIVQVLPSNRGGSATGSDRKGKLLLVKARHSVIDNRAPSNYLDGLTFSENHCCPIVGANLDYAVKKALTDCKLTPDTGDFWTEEDKAKARELLGVVNGNGSGSPNLYRHRAVCYESGYVYSFLSYDNTPFSGVENFSAAYMFASGSFSHIYQFFDTEYRVLSSLYSNGEMTLYYCDYNGNITNVKLNVIDFIYEVKLV